jgi:chromosome segregation ATPase
MPVMTKPAPDRIMQLEDDLKIALQRVDEMREERDEANATVAKALEHLQEHREIMERWRMIFHMIEVSPGKWEWETDHWLADYNRLFDENRRLVSENYKLWCRIVPGDIGRPLAASEAQCEQVLKLRKEGTPLRLIVDETGLGLQTVRTIIGRETRSDRTTVKRKRKHMPEPPDKAAVASHKASKRTFEALPRQVAKHLEAGAELIKAAKGLGR